jgi:chromosome partitioning protein
MSMKVITVAHLKGGAAKTTTAGYLAHALANMGHKVLAIDADPQGSLLRWSRRAKWSIPVRHIATDHLDKDLAGMYTDEFDFVVIDTAPYDRGTVAAAFRAANTIVVTCPPNFEDVAQVKATYELIQREHPDADVRVLLTRVDARSVSPRFAREAMTAGGRVVMKAEITSRQQLAQATATMPSPDRGFGGYTGVALELLT